MKQLNLKSVMVVLVVLFSLHANAYDAFVDGLYYNLDQDSKTAEVTNEKGSNQYSGDIVIPSFIDVKGVTYKVTSIGNSAFANCTKLTSVIIPNSVVSIGGNAFNDCHSLTSLIIPNSVTSIGSWAFKECVHLTSVTIGKGVTSMEGAFLYCTNLASIVVDEDNPVYDSRNNCNAVIETATNTLVIGGTKTVIPNSVTSIGPSAFYGCDGLISIDIPNSVTYIGPSAFYGCDGLTSVTFPNSVTEIDSNPFLKCSRLSHPIYNSTLFVCLPESYKGEFAVPDGIKTICSKAFQGCYQSISVTMPNSVTSIGEYAFYNSRGLTSVTISNSITEIGQNVFGDCSSLRSVTIPESVTSISAAFSGCGGLTSIKVESGNPKYDSRENCNAIIETATNQLMLGCRYTTIPNSVTSIGSGAFSGCRGLTSITIPNSVTSIGGSAFSGCSDLTSVTIPSSITSIEGSTFYDCSSLTSVTIPNSVTSIGNSAFSGCKQLIYMTIPNSVTSIGNSAFYGWKQLWSVTIPNSVTIMGDGTFCNCSGLTWVTIPNSVTSIGSSAFYGCSWLTSVTIGGGVTYIGNHAFAGCEKMKNVYCYAESVPSTHQDTFSNTNIMNIILHVPELSLNAYKTTAPWSVFGQIVPLTQKEIDNYISTDIDAIVTISEDAYQIYTPDGTRVETLQKGVNIIKYKNGTSKKVFVK